MSAYCHSDILGACIVTEASGRTRERASDNSIDEHGRTILQVPGWLTGHTDITQFVTMMERAKGLEPLPETWRATILPLNYTRTLFLPPLEAFTNAPFGPLQIEGTTSFIGKL